ncbi:GMC oxidoreductase-domain-containing protein [Mycena polygramma]|nr:GMC oxidoreductase-domain-containing protein [Mycena polygramma]
MWPFSSSYPQRAVDKIDSEYDFIVVGGGNAGCVLARRLSEGGKHTVLLVERGDAGDSWLDRAPLLSLHHWSNGKHSKVFDSAPDPQLGRPFSLITGIGLGGTTRINGGQYTCGVPAEYNAWSADGRPGWGYEDLKPYFLKSESWSGPVPKEWHGSNGPLKVRSLEGYEYGSSQQAANAASRLGFLPILDMHSPLEPSVGWNKMQYALGADGTRQSAFRAYLPRAVADDLANQLHICTKAVAAKLGFSRQPDGKLRAESVEIHSVDGRHVRIVNARKEIVLTCGALETPKVLLLSGVGPEEHLKKMGVEVLQHSPAVGANLQDHLYVPTSYNCPLLDSMWAMFRRPQTLISQVYKYLRYGTGWLLGTTVEVEIFGMSSVIHADGKPDPLSSENKDSFDPKNQPDFAVLTCGIADPRGPGVDRSKGFFGLNCGLLRAKSRGRLLLHSRDPMASPICEMNYLTSPEDWAALRASIRVSVALARQMRTEGYALGDVNVPSALDDATLDDFIKAGLETMYHYSSSCRMAPQDDPLPGVVDHELRVHAIQNLRISDASVFPNVPCTHPQALVYAVAEKCADMMLRQASA